MVEQIRYLFLYLLEFSCFEFTTRILNSLGVSIENIIDDPNSSNSNNFIIFTELSYKNYYDMRFGNSELQV